MLSDVMHHMEPITEFSMKNVKANQIIPTYVHDGSESNNDEFKIKITDGRHVSKKLLVSDVHWFYATSIISLQLLEFRVRFIDYHSLKNSSRCYIFYAVFANYCMNCVIASSS